MIDFHNSEFIKMARIDPAEIVGGVAPLLIEGEEVVAAFKAMRDYCVFTNRRIVSVNVQGVTGRKKDYTSLPYSKITAFSVETAGVADIDSELELCFSGLGKVKFEFTSQSDVLAIDRLISWFVL